MRCHASQLPARWHPSCKADVAWRSQGEAGLRRAGAGRQAPCCEAGWQTVLDQQCVALTTARFLHPCTACLLRSRRRSPSSRALQQGAQQTVIKPCAGRGGLPEAGCNATGPHNTGPHNTTAEQRLVLRTIVTAQHGTTGG